ncbi:MAG: hypothetical protein HVN35_10955 [Methanobacteriaceae archaeon]|nr:hypothetical protein [Methanobacteriaceae archaeon]
MVYRHWVDPLLLYLGMAFLVFGISNLIQIIGITNQEVLILFQLFAFILIMYGLYSEWKYFKSSQDQDEYESPPDE